MTRHGLGVDLGSSSVRAVVVDERGGLSGPAARRPVAILHGPDGAATLDARSYLAAVVACVDEVLGHPDLPALDVVALTSQWHGLVPVDATGAPLGPLVTWADARAGRAVADPAGVDLEALRQRTGCALHALYWTVRIPWWTRERGGGAAAFWGAGDLVRHVMVGAAGTTVSMASGTGLLDQGGMRWDDEALGLAGVTAAALPPLVPTRGTLGSEARRRWPALVGAELVGPIGDGAAANLGSGCADHASVALTIGTSAAVRLLHDRLPATAVPEGCWRYLLDEERAVTGRAWSAGGNVVRWARENLHLPAELEKSLGAHDGRPGRVLALPHLYAARPPETSPPGAGALLGLDASAGPVELLVGLLDGVACEVCDGLEHVGDLAAPGAVAVVGGGALDASPWWRQRLCDLAGRPLAYASGPEVSARGAVTDALGVRLPPPEPTLEPAAGPAFAAQRARYDRARRALARLG